MRYCSRLACLAVLVLLSACAASQPGSATLRTVVAEPLPASGDHVQDKNFPLLTLLQQDPVAAAALQHDTVLSALGEHARTALAQSWDSCTGTATSACVVDLLHMSDADIEQVAERLQALAQPGAALAALPSRMRASGRFARHEALDDAALLAAAWREAAAGVNRLYRVYGQGEAPLYPAIDAVSHDPASNDYAGLVRAIVETALDDAAAGQVFFATWLRVGLDYLVINQRDEAARYEPMQHGANAAALSRAQTLDWSAWPYTAIVVPGAGTLPGETGLSAAGELRIRLAARRYAAGQAPLLIVSGGHVHPNKTPYAEAIEMKAELMQRHGVPEHAILVDPHARHTTTNLRNAVRLLQQAGAPLEREVLVTTANSQSVYIESSGFAGRNLRELGYEPMTVLRRLSPQDLLMLPQRLSLHADPRDPLDP